jgi:hypothetical protein
MATATISKMAAVRKAIAALGKNAMPLTIQEYVKTTFGLSMTTAHVSNYKTTVMREKGKKKSGPKMDSDGSAATPALYAKTSKPASGHGVSLQDVATVKGLVGRVGQGNLKSLIDLLG